MKHFPLTRLLAATAVLLWCVLLTARAATPVEAVDSIGIPVRDMERSRAFYRGVFGFREIADREVFGEPYEKLYGVFGVRLRAVRMQLGDEFIELMQFQTPRGRPLPGDSRANDRW
jgi:catechol 2,3-dioxygenase-like lactoylglutathione lyase family enzyme